MNHSVIYSWRVGHSSKLQRCQSTSNNRKG